MSRPAHVGICLLVLAAGCTGAVPWAETSGARTSLGSTAVAGGDAVTVTNVVDGDTVDVRYPDGREETVRLLGVDTPEVRGETSPEEFEGVPDTSAGRACLASYADRASGYAESRLEGRRVALVSDPATDRRDPFGRVLAYVVVDDEQFNYALLREGYARLYDTAFGERERYAAAEREAREARRGLWSCIDTATDNTTTSDSPLVLDAHPDAEGNDNENLNDEYVTLHNSGEEPLNLSGWTVSDATGKTYTFGEETHLDPGASVTLYTGPGTDGEGVRYWGRDSAVWNNDGDTVIVRDDGGDVVLRRSI